MEYISFYGDLTNVPVEDQKRISMDLIRASPLSGLKPSIWNDDNKAETRISNLYEFVTDKRDEARQDESVTGSNPSPQDLSNASVAGSIHVSNRKKDIRKDLLGK